MSILLIDSYDSFTNNLKALIESVVGSGVTVHTVTNDSYTLPEDVDKLESLLKTVDAVVIGPGPGSPEKSEDVGIIPYVLEKQDMPILGVCLGFQCLCLKHGSTVHYLENPVHGQIHDVVLTLDGKTDLIFKDFPGSFASVRYHSICIDRLGDEMVPLGTATNGEPPVLMAARHKIWPHFGVQYHPESICSTEGQRLIKNFWDLAKPESLTPSSVPQTLSKPVSVSEPEIVGTAPITTNCPLALCEALGEGNFLLLNSASEPGEWSIVGIPVAGESDVISHSTEDPDFVGLSKWGSSTTHSIKENIWEYLGNYMKARYRNIRPVSGCPFVGGLVGFVSYEEGHHVVPSALPSLTSSKIPDMRFCLIERFIVLRDGKSKLVSVRPNDDEWLNEMAAKLNGTANTPRPLTDLSSTVFEKPDKRTYFDQFAQCQKYLHSGDSYELCLCTSTKIHVPKDTTSWEVYRHMVAKNASPYSAFMDFGDSCLLSTSPERFLYWDTKECQMRPIKGTVRKTPEVDLAAATKMLKIPKEMGENLMIVDLIRHDLYPHLQDVHVTKLMGVEEYQTVYQLVSVIEGERNDGSEGIETLREALPPGSMTGAPKKRSVELLQRIEGARRGIYSGIAGYWSLNDTADWSVVIRSFFHYRDDLENTAETQCFRCGAGGAVTVLSTAEGEWNELNVKLDSVMQVFED